MPTYVAGDVRSIQDYIFASPRLLEMRGASGLIDFFDRRVVPALVKSLGGWKVFSGGGNFLASFEDAAEPCAAEFVDRVRSAFLDLTSGDGITVVSLATAEPFAEAQAELWKELRRAKRSSAGARQLVSMPFLKRCESCGQETADEGFRRPGEEGPDARYEWLGPACARKHRMHGRLREAYGKAPGEGPTHWVHGLPQPLEVPVVTERLRGAELPADFRELTGEDDLALVVADGNGLGDWFAGLDLPIVKELSEKVDAALRHALDEATETAFPKDRPRLQVLLCGGDDLVVALPARRGLRFATKLLESFVIRHPADSERTAGMAAGLLFSKPSFPFRQAYKLAVSLLGRAKARCYREGVQAALDFHRVTATQVQSLERERAAIEGQGKGVDAWSYGAAGPYTPQEMQELLGFAGRLRVGVTPSQRGVLRQILSRRDDGPDSPLHPVWKVPQRVVAELQAWLVRQEGDKPFAAPEETVPSDILREERVYRPDGATRVYRRLRLSDALLLADLEIEEG